MKLKQMEFKADFDAETGKVSGYASTWDREPDSYGDVVAKGAFASSLKRWQESGSPIPLLFGHNADDPYYNIGALTEAKEDERGLYVEGGFDDSDMAQRVRALASEGRLKSFSFAYDVIESAEVTLEDGRKARELRELEIYEVSVVTFPANSHADITDVKDAGGAMHREMHLDIIPHLKAGRVLSKSNEEDLRQARDLIDGVLGRLDSGEGEEDGKGGKSEDGDVNDEAAKAKSEALEKISKILGKE